MGAARPAVIEDQPVAPPMQDTAADATSSPDVSPRPRTKNVPHMSPPGHSIPSQRSRPLLDSSLALSNTAQSAPRKRGPKAAQAKVALVQPASGVDQHRDTVHTLLALVQGSLQQVQKQLQAARLRPGKSLATVQLVQPQLVSVP